MAKQDKEPFKFKNLSPYEMRREIERFEALLFKPIISAEELEDEKQTPPEMLRVARDCMAELEEFRKSPRVQKIYAKMLATLRESLRRGAVPGLPDAVFETWGRGGRRAFLPESFLLDAPLALFDRRSHEESSELELTTPRGETYTREVYTIRESQGAKVQRALTGRQENVLFTLFNDEFLNLLAGPRLQSYITGTVSMLQDIMGLGGKRPRARTVISDLNAVAEIRVRLRNAVHDRADGIPYDVRGPLFVADIMPGKGGAAIIDGEPKAEGKFRLVVKDDLAFHFLLAAYQRIDLEKFWSIPKPRDRHVYAYLSLRKNSWAHRLDTFCQVNGFRYEGARLNNVRRAVRDSLNAVAEHTLDFRPRGYGRQEWNNWFVTPDKVSWEPGVWPIVPSDIRQSIQESQGDKRAAGKVLEETEKALRRGHETGGKRKYKELLKGHRRRFLPDHRQTPFIVPG